MLPTLCTYASTLPLPRDTITRCLGRSYLWSFTPSHSFVFSLLPLSIKQLHCRCKSLSSPENPTCITAKIAIKTSQTKPGIHGAHLRLRFPRTRISAFNIAINKQRQIHRNLSRHQAPLFQATIQNLRFAMRRNSLFPSAKCKLLNARAKRRLNYHC
jgi:hypothetical protein